MHRDLRWANVIRILTSRTDGSIESTKYLLIDFEFSEVNGEPMLINDYIFSHVVPYGAVYTTKNDMYFVGNMISTWAESNGEPLDVHAMDFVLAVQDNMDAAAALAHPWCALGDA